jgi:hypothetical protein
MQVLTVPAGPGDYRCFLAVISRGGELPQGRGGDAVVTVALAGGEAETFFLPGQPFTIWADCRAGDALWPGGQAGHGVICGRVSLAPAGAGTEGHQGRTAGPGRWPPPAPVPATVKPRQRVAV